ETRHQVVVLNQPVVDLKIALIAIELARRGSDVVPGRSFRAADVGQWNQFLVLQSCWVKAALRDRVTRKQIGVDETLRTRPPRGGVINEPRGTREITAPK